MNSWIYPYLKQYKGRILLSLVLGILGIGSGAMLLFISGYLISKSSLRPENIMMVYVPIVAVRAFSIGQAVFIYLEKLVSHDLVLRMLENMRTKLYQIVEPQALFLRSRFQTGDLLSVLSDDIEHLQDFYLRTIFPSVLGVGIYAVFIGVIGLFDWAFAILMVLLLGVLVFLLPLFSLFITRRHHTKQKQRRNSLYRQLTDAIFGQMDWQASGRTSEVLERFEIENRKVVHTEQKIRRWRHVRDAVLRLTVGVLVVAMILWTDMQTEQGLIAPTIIAAFVLMIFSITDALIPISDAVEHVPSYMDSIARIKQVQHDEPKTNENLSHSELQITNSHMEINEISYRYPDTSSPAIDKLSLKIPPGSKIAILGKSGTGKSTLLKMMAGALQPDEGSITVGDKKMVSSLLSIGVSVLNQKPHLFDTTIGNNIRIGNPHATEEEVWKAVEQAQLASLISSLPNGLRTPMQEMGKRFSGGERQRIAFARVLLQNTPIILMDEPTIGLDPITEQELVDTMLAAAKDKTVIWVTHHLAGVEAMDKVIFMDNGRIAMQGSHHELLQTNERYRKLYEMDQGLGADS